MQHFPLDSLRARREARAHAARRRRRQMGLLIALAVVAGSLALAMEPVGTARQRRRHRAVSPAALSATAPRTAGEAPARGLAPAERSGKYAAVKRLAAYGLPLYCGGRSRRDVALTFDDGPGVYTRLAVKKLRAHHVRVTFFLVGKALHAFPRLVQIEKPDAEFGDHTMTHPFLPALPHNMMVQELAQAKSLIERATGTAVLLFRPPYEAHTRAIDETAHALGMLEVLWNVDSRDSEGETNYLGIEHNVIAGLKPGSIVLMHENHGQTIRALPAIFTALTRDHLRAVTVPELVAQDPPSPSQLRAGIAGCSAMARATGGGS